MVDKVEMTEQPISEKRVVDVVLAGADWLLDRQNTENGCWGECSPWLTGVVLRVLGHVNRYRLPKKTVKKKIEKAIENGFFFLKSNVGHDGGWDDELGLWDTAIIVRGLVVTGYKDDFVCKKGVEYMRNRASQFWESNLPYYGASYPAEVLTSLYEFEGKDKVKTYQWYAELLSNSQEEDGSWNCDYFNTAESLEAITIMKKALSGSQSTFSKLLNENQKNAMRWLEEHQGKNGLWGGLTWTHAVALNAYLKSWEERKYSPTAVSGLEWLIGQQHSNGSWWHLPDHTAFSILALVEYIRRERF